jgi:hypothetical protein
MELTPDEQAIVDKGLWIWHQPANGPTTQVSLNRADLTSAENAAEHDRLLEQYARMIEAEQRELREEDENKM